MAKKAKKKVCDEMPPWLITFTDVMTLMLTFFVLLVSMARVDERRKLVVLGSIIGTFGFHEQSYELYSRKDTKRTVEPGPIDSGDLEPLKPLLWEDAENDLSFQESKFVQVLSINADVLFRPGDVALSERGMEILTVAVPVLRNLRWPVLIAGHASERRDEEGARYEPEVDDTIPDSSWRLSLDRALAVFSFMLNEGVPADMMRVEGYGRFSPLAPNDTPEGRRQNRRVDIVLDKRSTTAARELDAEMPENRQEPDGTVDVDGFIFRVDEELPAGEEGGQ
ncbi:OmpA/MotB family protein [Salidesulfovibrio brasiliensis]|uniref:OmpA/MotB family protein n=1 Tax=Salidesulfovibrio brasiliensis TaxID=221711 RepID=UPI0006D1A4A8|nr:OmpA family protein [Salidesulfovibrio brasiliensis]